jgi:hypothetical protein
MSFWSLVMGDGDGDGDWLLVISYQTIRFNLDNQTVIIIFENIKGHSSI